MTPTLDPKVIQILDEAVRLSLLTFWVLLVCLYLYSFYTHNRRRLTGPRGEENLAGSWQILRPLLSATLVAGLLAGLSFLFFAFVPAPFLDNFSTRQDWMRAPIRITRLNFDRTYEGFSLNGEFWNQGEEKLDNVELVVSVLDHNLEQLDELVVSPTPAQLEAGQTAAFEVRYTRNSTLIHGYQLWFRSQDGSRINHVAGFNVD